MKVITWNVNSLRMRLPRVLRLIDRHQPDVLCLQEIKLQDSQFPSAAFESLGYACACFGQHGGYNGVAVLSRLPISGVNRGFEGDPIPADARVLSLTVGNTRLVNLYVVNGQAVESPKYQLKLDWLDQLYRWLDHHFSATEPLLLLGDFNIAPDDRDVYDPILWKDRVHCTTAERTRLQTLMAWGLVDLLRLDNTEAGVYTWWDYRANSFQRGLGLRIDLVLGSADMAQRCRSVTVDRDERNPRIALEGLNKPSDHAPLIAEFAAKED